MKKEGGKKRDSALTGGQSGSGGHIGDNSGSNAGGNTARTEEMARLSLVNDFRAQSGESALGRGDKQDTAGSNHSREMANREFFSHTTPVGGTPGQRMAVAGDSYRRWGKYID